MGLTSAWDDAGIGFARDDTYGDGVLKERIKIHE